MSFSNHLMEVINQFAEETIEEGASTGGEVDTGKSTDPLSKQIPVSRLREALLFADPDNTRAGVNKLLARGCNLTVESMLALESKRGLISLEVFKINLKNGLLKKSVPNSNLRIAKG